MYEDEALSPSNDCVFFCYHIIPNHPCFSKSSYFKTALENIIGKGIFSHSQNVFYSVQNNFLFSSHGFHDQVEGLAQEHAIFTYRDFSGAAIFYLSSLIKHIHDPNLDSLFLLVYFIILNIPHSLIIIITA